MHRSILSDEHSGLKVPVPNPLAVTIIASLWLLFACGLPLYQLREARLQAREDLQQLLVANQPDKAGVIAAFDRSNQNLDAAASGPCLLLAFTSFFLVNQLLKLKRQYHALAHDLSAPNSRGAESNEAPEN